MKKFISLFLIILLLTITFSCGNSKVINNVEYETYGFINENEIKAPNIKYKIIVGNLIWSFVLLKTIVFPVYFIGFSLWEPVEENKKLINL